MMVRKFKQTDGEVALRDEAAACKESLRLWLRLLSCTNLITAEIRKTLRSESELTLPRFNVLAQLYQEPQGLPLSELSKRMMVSNGNVTGLTDRLIDDGYIHRITDPNDRRVSLVGLTEFGSKCFERLAHKHEAWLTALFHRLSPDASRRLMEDLATLKRSVIEADASEDV